MREIFVFGSNLAGRHGKGAAATAMREHGAIYGQSFGLQGNSYGIPTKNKQLKTLPLESIERYIKSFLEDAKLHPELFFNITRIGCGLAGYDWDKDIRPLFPPELPENCRFI